MNFLLEYEYFFLEYEYIRYKNIFERKKEYYNSEYSDLLRLP